MTSWWKKPEEPVKKTDAHYILGVSSSAEGSSAAMLRDGKIIFSAFVPPPAAFPGEAVSAALEKASEAEGRILGVKDMAAVAFCGKPLREYSCRRSEWLASAPGGFGHFLKTAPGAFAKKHLGSGRLERELASASWGENPAVLLYPEIQLSCAASAFYPSPFEDSAILVLDGPGDGAAASISLGSGEKIKLLREFPYPDSPQLLASALAAYAGFEGDSAWELFTAPEEADKQRSSEFYTRITRELAEIRDDGSLRLNRHYFTASKGMKPDFARWEELFGSGPRGSGPLEGAALDFAAAARSAIEEVVLRLASHAKRFAFSTNLCLCASPELKLAAEGKLKAAGLFTSIWSQPYSAPEGKAAGAALAARHVYFGIKRPPAYDRNWDGPKEQPLPEEQEQPLEVAPPPPPPAWIKIWHCVYFWLILAPYAAFLRISGSKRGKKTAGPAKFYVSRNRIYTREDLQGAG